MTHVFVSYKKEDTYQLRALVSVLKQADIPFWADIELEAGTGWRDEIDAALEQSFAVAVIVTSGSMSSQYVTYEWSWALGNGIPVIPLLFQPSSAVQIHQRLQAIQYITCYPDIPDSVAATLKATQKESYLVRALNLRINQIIHPLRIFGMISFWLVDYICAQGIRDKAYLDGCERLINEFISILGEIVKNDLPAFWVGSSSAFPARQKRSYEQMVEALDRFYSDPNYFTVLHTILLSSKELEIVISAKQKWQAEVEPTFSAFPSEAEQSFTRLSAKLNSMNDRKVKKDDYEGEDILNDFNNHLLMLLPKNSFTRFILYLDKLGLYKQLG